MASGKATYLQNKLLDLVLSATAFSAPATVYAALYTTTPSAGGTGGTEVTSANGYARVAVTNNATNWPAASSGSKSNATAITFPQASGSWGTVTGVGIFDASTNGNLLYWGALNSSQAIGNGNTASFAASALTVTET